jgi:hypothetical protein
MGLLMASITLDNITTTTTTTTTYVTTTTMLLLMTFHVEEY